VIVASELQGFAPDPFAKNKRTGPDRFEFRAVTGTWSHHAAAQIGTPLTQWLTDAPADINRDQVAELNILKFVTVEQLALASDNQLQRVGMGGIGLREKARAYLNRKNRTETNAELADTKAQLAELKAQLAELTEPRRRGRPPKDDTEG